MTPSTSAAYGSFDAFDNAFSLSIVSRDNFFQDDAIDNVDDALVAPDGSILNLVEVDDDTKHGTIAGSGLSHVGFRDDFSCSLAGCSASYINNDDIAFAADSGTRYIIMTISIGRKFLIPKGTCAGSP